MTNKRPVDFKTGDLLQYTGPLRAPGSKWKRDSSFLILEDTTGLDHHDPIRCNRLGDDGGYAGFMACSLLSLRRALTDPTYELITLEQRARTENNKE